MQVKPLPISGTGKHKYSFQRIEVPPLPTYFCDCEEHFVATFGNSREKETHGFKDKNGGMMYEQEKGTHHLEEDHGSIIDEQEINLMNSVMNQLFGRELFSSATCNGETAPDAENEADEDNIVTNVLSRGKTGMDLSRCQQDPTISQKRQVGFLLSATFIYLSFTLALFWLYILN